MAFIPISTDDGHVLPLEYLPCSAITPKIGMALYQSSGKLAIATTTTKPTYISAVEKSAAVTAGDIIPVWRVDSDTIWKTTNSASFTSRKLGDKVQLHASSGLQVTATVDDGANPPVLNGVAEVIYIGGTATGSEIHVRF